MFLAPRILPGAQKLLYTCLLSAKENKIVFTCFLVSSLFRDLAASETERGSPAKSPVPGSHPPWPHPLPLWL